MESTQGGSHPRGPYRASVFCCRRAVATCRQDCVSCLSGLCPSPKCVCSPPWHPWNSQWAGRHGHTRPVTDHVEEGAGTVSRARGSPDSFHQCPPSAAREVPFYRQVAGWGRSTSWRRADLLLSSMEFWDSQVQGARGPVYIEPGGDCPCGHAQCPYAHDSGGRCQPEGTHYLWGRWWALQWRPFGRRCPWAGKASGSPQHWAEGDWLTRQLAVGPWGAVGVRGSPVPTGSIQG